MLIEELPDAEGLSTPPQQNRGKQFLLKERVSKDNAAALTVDGWVGQTGCFRVG